MEKPFDKLLREQCEALANLDSTLADLRRGNKDFSPVPATLDTATNRFLDAITKPYRDRNAA